MNIIGFYLASMLSLNTASSEAKANALKATMAGLRIKPGPGYHY